MNTYTITAADVDWTIAAENVGLARAVAASFQRRAAGCRATVDGDVEDLTNVAAIELARVAAYWKPELGSLANLAWPAMNRRVGRELRRMSTVYVPFHHRYEPGGDVAAALDPVRDTWTGSDGRVQHSMFDRMASDIHQLADPVDHEQLTRAVAAAAFLERVMLPSHVAAWIAIAVDGQSVKSYSKTRRMGRVARVLTLIARAYVDGRMGPYVERVAEQNAEAGRALGELLDGPTTERRVAAERAGRLLYREFDKELPKPGKEPE